MNSDGKIDSIYDFSDKGLRELESWLEPWFLGKKTRAVAGPAGIDFNKLNDHDALGVISNYLDIRVEGDPAGLPAISLENNTRSDAGIEVRNNSNGQINIQNTGGDGGIHIENDGGFAANDRQAGVYVEDNGEGGVYILATGSGNGFDAGRFTVENNGGQLTLKNTDEGIIIYSTGEFTSGRLTDFTTITGDPYPPGMVIAAADGIVLSSAAPEVNQEFGVLGTVFLYCYTGGPNLLQSPVLLATTSDPHIAGALWNSGGTVKISAG